MDRRWLLALALAIRSLGIALWLVWPTFYGLMLGSILWAIHSALASGAWEALVYDTLSKHGDDDGYPVVMARIGQASSIAVAAGALASTALLAAGLPVTSLGWITVLLGLPPLALVVMLPKAPAEPADEQGGFAGWASTLRQGAKDARQDPQTLKLVLLGGVLGGLFIVDEYVPLLARLREIPDHIIPLVVAAVWAGVLAGGELAARRPNMSPRSLGATLTVGSLAMLGGLMAGSAWSLLLVAVGYGALQTTWVLSDARFQASIPAATRATVTSIRALLSGGVSLVVLAGIGLVAQGQDPTRGLVMLAGLLTVAGIVVSAWVPPAASAGNDDAGP
ncbi:MAG: hypothetical protein JKY37_24745 [Nannocystaceae bacterium]|nr:hypothetical protein [Nannocystaceae bacterium]